MVTGSTLDLSKQAELTIITAAQISDLAEGSAIIYRKANEVGNLIPALGFVSKDGTVTDLPYPGTEI